MKTKSIIRRITFASVALVLCGIGFAMIGTYWVIYDRSMQDNEKRLNEQLAILAGSLIQPLWSFDSNAVKIIADTYSAHEDVVYLKIFADTPGQPVYERDKVSNAKIAYKSKSIGYKDQTIGGVEIGISMNAYRDTLNNILWFGLGSAALISVFIILGVRHFLTIFLEAPLRTLSGWAREVASGKYDAVSGEIQETELHGLARQFQNMAGLIANREMELRKLSMATEQSPASVVITDTDGRIEYVNQAFEKITGYTVAEVKGRNAGLVKSGETPDSLYKELWLTIRAGYPWQGELNNRSKDGRTIWERTHIAPVRNSAGEISHYIAVKEDITLRKKQEQRILHQAHFDSLTDLPNRFLCLDRLSQLIKEAHRDSRHVAVLFLDLDDFKKINDSLGHEVGDKLLVRAAQRLSETVRESDTVGRLGGDEFIMLVGDMDAPTDANPIADNLLGCFRHPFRMDGRELLLTASLGVACFPEDGETPAELLRNADTAMYHSKAEGRNTYHYFTAEMNKGVSRRLRLEEQLHGALERNEFDIYYQPIVDSRSRRCVAAEALLRWTNPALGAVPPVEFIRIAEQTGTIVPIGQYVLQQALAAAAEWQSDYAPDLRISVNLSPRQFRDPMLNQFVRQTLQQTGVSAGSLTLELTEGVLMSGHAHVDAALADLDQLGVRIAMDDFGIGYSSLSYLRSYPFDTLKIDRSFIADMTVDPADRELVNAAIKMASALGLKVVAEGVETEQQLAILIEQGCDWAQGYLFGKPMPQEAFNQLLSAQAALPVD